MYYLHGKLQANISLLDRNQTIPRDFDLSEIQISSNPIIHNRLKDILLKYSEVFSGKIGRMKLIDHKIRIKTTNPISLNPYSYLEDKQNIINDMIKHMEEQGLVEPCPEPYL